MRRHGEVICAQDYSDIIIQAGDYLLIETSATFYKDHSHSSAFAVVKEIHGSRPPRNKSQKDQVRKLFVLLMLIVLVVLSYEVSLLILAFVFCALLLATSTIHKEQLVASVHFHTVVFAAFSISMAIGFENLGLGAAVAIFLVKQIPNAILLMLITYLGTSALCMMICSTGAALLALPFGIKVATLTCQDYGLYVYLIILAASSGYITPFAFPTNEMVLGPGGYSKMDYIKFGLPL